MVLKITPELIVQSLALAPDLTKEKLERLYREDWLSLKRLAPLLSEEYGSTLTMKHVAALLEHHGIPKWTHEEQRAAAKHRPPNQANIEAKAEELAKLGYSKVRLLDLYREENLSKNELITLINDEAGSEVVNKTWLRKVMEYHGIEKKSAEEQWARREEVSRVVNMERYGVPYASQHESVKAKVRATVEANGGFTLQRPEYKQKVLDAALAKRALKPSPYFGLAQVLAESGLDRSGIEKLYLSENLNPSELAVRIFHETSIAISYKQAHRLLGYLEIEKPRELIRKKQGEMSRNIRDANLQKLATLGYTPESLAIYYDANKTLTYDRLLDELNAKLDSSYEPFNTRWLEKKIYEHLPPERLRGVSREELAFGEDLKTIYSGPIEHGNRKLIAPYHVDYYLPQLNLAIEFNGELWHSDRIVQANHGMSAEDYHTMKRLLCRAQGVRLLFVWAKDWRNDLSGVLDALSREFAGDSSSSELLTILTKG